MKERRRKVFGAIALVVWYVVPSVGAITIPDTSRARAAVLERMTAPVQRYEAVVRELIPQPGGDPVIFRTEEQNESRYYLFIAPDDDRFDLASPGTVIVRRRIGDGAFEQIKIFLQHHEGSFVRLRPRGRTLRMDLFLAWAPLYRDVPVPITMERALTVPFATLRDATRGVVDWSLLEPDVHHPGYAAIRRMIEEARRALPDASDGAVNVDGSPVFIETVAAEEAPALNYSGFAKWVVDGLYGARTGSYLPVESLRHKHLDHRGTAWSAPREDDRDPYFALDWTRNLAREMYGLERGVASHLLDPEIADVRTVPVARYREDVGYAMDQLRATLYWLAVTEPGTVYLGSVNRSFGDELVLRQHTRVVVFLPYFDGEGRFEVAIMERAAETSLDALERRYEGDFVHLVRVRADERFDPPRFHARNAGF
ncbi:MAG: hypothetical protein MI724_09200 [Spirochaetales bacterium]|nr:hypothetical protein [Spirochaetales bacterium]